MKLWHRIVHRTPAGATDDALWSGIHRRLIQSSTARASSVRPVIAIIAALAILLTACQSEDKARRLNREGNTAFDAGDYQTALDRYRQAQVEAPDQAAYIYNGGNALHRLGQFDRAAAESQRAAANGPDDVRFRAYYALGNNYLRLEKLREARDAYKNALKLNPSDIDAKFNLEVVQRRLDERQQQQQGQQGQQNQQGQQGRQQGRNQPGQQQDQQQGQSQPGQQQGQNQPAQNQPAQNQPGQQQGQQPGQQQPGQGQSGQQPSQDGQPTAADLDRALRDATADFERNQSVEDALRILDVLEQQARLRQRQVPPQPPGAQRDQ